MSESKVLTTLTANAAGSEANPILHPTGFQVHMPFVEYLCSEGYVFSVTDGNLAAHNGGEEGADNQDINTTEPTFMFDVPAGLTVIPLYACVTWEEGTGTDNILAIIASANTTATYASGGVATTDIPRNIRTDNPRASQVYNVKQAGETPTDITANTLTNPRVLWLWSSPTSTETLAPKSNIVWIPAHLTCIVGSGAFLFYCHSITTEADIHTTFMWAELPSSLITQAI